MTPSFPASTVLGYPRIGPDRQLKRALESYWEGRSGRADLEETARRLREDTWRRLAALGLEGLPSNTFSYYDQVLDTAVLLGAVPGRYRHDDDLATYFAMARGAEGIAPLRMTKWFDTNYHYIVPEIGPDTVFSLDAAKPLAEVREARALGLETRPVLIGPVTFLLLSQAAPGSPDSLGSPDSPDSLGSPDGFTPLDRLDDVVEVYARLLGELAAEGVGWVQLDEPALVADRTPAELAAVEAAYGRLGRLEHRPALLVASYFGDLGDALPVLAGTPVEAVGLDLVRGTAQGVDALAGKTVVAGVVSGRDVWRADLDRALATLHAARERAGRVTVSTSCSLLHVPYDAERETGLDPALRERLAFAEQKVAEVVELAALLTAAPDHPAPGHPAPGHHLPGPAAAPGRPRASRARTAEGRAPYAVRAVAQAEHLKLPLLPVTTIGSFPQTGELRRARAALAAGEIGEAAYESMVRAEIEQVIALQERLGLDVLVHGEPERNDMVQYFAEHLDGFAVTRHGWVQSYGSRCTRPPLLHGDVRRPEPITVRWARYAQSLTSKPVKGMLTGPVTIVAWSFVRDDLPLREVVFQVADAVREEVGDLEEAGVRVIQVDEPALRELVPLRRAEQAAYLEWAVAAYRWATSGVSEHTQIHTHLCYSDADEILAAIDALDADVTSIESARSRGRLLGAVGAFPRGLGPGVYDIHSPRVPGAGEVERLLTEALRTVPAERLWVNPDCGLKTRSYEQVEAALAHVVEAAARLRERHA
ncbi:5-methyltetrahydropteroyltriglutamate--homocysteine S-methyltransferase [Microbispora bryophytorum]|uniref:5-methyltetrahydropteroyltriglutamate--homocysteine methyltransferase n=1 Tax=Microbispora bryophytorum TaxID=1460882 RepID=A0A8H9H1I7_9ACTN|nr:5-methyltetrahydropteroyltriglutamate--homocysteine S-methyltransferase [Microbispora bryophytorum]MBD3137651.1 5-methyltetrahydropteroyltriglutamate--homocysteine S-methyltransferase [Microbispora bryophytorum]TQS05935.1 5-methyltetrahydropteroyltriglutamate--homocysteine S-methyltransferase [Microbispora bryophytorum]GGO20208.1 5-methyltetrahydropteroyltriglutamate--homocysteine methyltransferase [Microbispora bryophytorum]